MNEKIKRKAHVKQSFSLDFLERGTFTEYPYIGDNPYSLDKGYTLGHVLSDPNSGSHSGGLYIGFEAVCHPYSNALLHFGS